MEEVFHFITDLNIKDKIPISKDSINQKDKEDHQQENTFNEKDEIDEYELKEDYSLFKSIYQLN